MNGLENTHFIFPIDGDCLNSFDGEVRGDLLKFKVKVASDPENSLLINGVPAVFDGCCHSAVLEIGMGKLTICACMNDGTPACAPITVYRLENAEGGYRISSDDNILFLRDINIHRNEYKSIFENPYLAVYKKAHDLYGAKIHLNLFYETDDMHGFTGDKGEYFNLGMMTDKFKDEFEENSDWLHLSFHARAEFPDKPYRHASAMHIIEDAQRVHNEIIRFAGVQTLACTTTVHWGEANRECTRGLRAIGYKTLAGYFEHTKKGEPLVAYYYPDSLIDHVCGRDFWMNTADDIFHSRIDLVLNMIKYEQLIPTLEEIKAQPHRAGFLELMIHEQYFHGNYCAYIPEFEKLVVDSAKWAYDNGYRGIFLDKIAPNA